MSAADSKWVIVGQGLAGTCLAWVLWQRGVAFTLIDRARGGSSRVAAGMINPITGKNFEPSWRIAEFLPDALRFFSEVEEKIGRQLWFPFPVVRLAETEKEWGKILAKISNPEVQTWIGGEVPAPLGWAGAMEVRGGGRLDVLAFLEGSREFFQSEGYYQVGEIANSTPHIIWCEGAVGLIAGKYGPHRCAKGEILTVRAEAWDESQIRVGAGGWLVPIGNGCFKAGSTYEWNELDEVATERGRGRVEEILKKLGGEGFQVIAHDAGVRPILRRSQPLIGPLDGGGWMFNALGSKGSLYAPGMARRLADWILDGVPPEPEVDFRIFLDQNLAS